MTRMLSVLTVVAGILVGGLGTAPAHAAHPGVLRVDDRAGAFTPEGIRKAEAQFHDVEFKSPTHFTVVTVGERHVPSHLKADFEAVKSKKGDAREFFSGWAREEAKAGQNRGIFALAFLHDDQFYIQLAVDRETDIHRDFTDSKAKKLSDALIDGFRSAKGKSDELARHTRDAALFAASEIVVNELRDTSVGSSSTANRNHASDDGESRRGMNIMGWVCIALVIGLGIWLVIGIIRAFTGGYAGGGPGGGYGYGGGGFFPSLMGGMFGAMAGMWLYDQFTGSHYHDDAMAADSGGDMGDTGDTGAGDFDGGAEAGGGDFGDGGGDYGGGDYGGDYGGGDFGGGDFGGGDFGGGDW